MNATVYTKEGKKSREIVLPAKVFGAKANADLIHQVVVSQTSSARSPIAHTKTRGEVRGGGKKPWQQKGTGRARHGSIRSPIWVGGGVAHGPRNDKNYLRKVNRKMKAAALANVLSGKAKSNEIILVENFALAGKTRDGVAVVRALAKGADIKALIGKKQNAAYFLFAVKNPMTERALRNIGNLSIGETRNLDVVSALKYKYLVFIDPERSFEILQGKLGEALTAEGWKEKVSEKAPRKTAVKKTIAKKVVKKTAKRTVKTKAK
ncbi:MAG TPA: 50S ribosomal protein L4 [Candidatus Paceibacterota bacterium]